MNSAELDRYVLGLQVNATAQVRTGLAEGNTNAFGLVWKVGVEGEEVHLRTCKER